MRLGAVAAEANQDIVEVVGMVGMNLGVYLQMLDDYSSIVTAKRFNKATEDLTHRRLTWPMAWLAETAATQDFHRFTDAMANTPLEQLIDTLRLSIRDKAEHELSGARQAMISLTEQPSLHIAKEDLFKGLDMLEGDYGI
jgi:geranylgeranyl pyrophosphate synthase